MKKIEQWDVWFANVPFEDTKEIKKRPVIIISVEPLQVLSIKVTSHESRKNDPYDVALKKWKEAGLNRPSTARISKMQFLPIENMDFKMGTLDTLDRYEIAKKIQELTK